MQTLVSSGSVRAESDVCFDDAAHVDTAVGVLRRREGEEVVSPVSLWLAATALWESPEISKRCAVELDHAVALGLDAVLGEVGITDEVVIEECAELASDSLGEAQRVLEDAANGCLGAWYTLAALQPTGELPA